jgi:DNA repair exonuclease SbcCD ATPase subunit
MFRRIFGIGKKKNSEKHAPSGTGGSILTADSADGTELHDSVVPLHSQQSITRKKKDPAEVLNEAVEKLVDKLEGINNNLQQQVEQNQQLVKRIDTLPDLLSSLPGAVEQQRKAFSRVAEQLQQKVERDAKVAEELGGIREQVTASVEMDVQMNERFGQFSECLTKLDQNTANQSAWLEQINSTFSASERYVKYAFTKQQNRFYWIFGISLGVCLLSVIGLIVGIMLLTRG